MISDFKTLQKTKMFILDDITKEITEPSKVIDFEIKFPSIITSDTIYGYYGGPFIFKSILTGNQGQFYSNSGKKIGNLIKIEFYGQIFTSFLLINCSICYLLKDSTIIICQPNGKVLKKINPIQKYQVLCASHSYKGISFINQNRTIFFFDSFELNIIKVIPIEENIVPLLISVLDIENDQFLIISDDNSLYLKNQLGISHVKSFSTPIFRLLVPYKGTHAALVSDECVYFTQINKTITNITQDELPLPNDTNLFSWAGETTFIMASSNKSKDSIIVYRNFSTLVSYDYPNIIGLIQDFKCCRIITNNGCYLIRDDIPEFSKFIINNNLSKELAKSYELYNNKNIDCYTSIQKIKLKLLEPINFYINAAKSSLILENQQKLLNIANFGRNFYNFNCSEEFSSSLKFIRLRNFLNSIEIGFCLTSEMFEIIQPYLLEIFLNLSLYDNALLLSDFFDFSKSQIAERWAIDMIYSTGSSHHELILKKLVKYEEVNYILLSQTAVEKNISNEIIYKFCERIQPPKLKTQFLFSLNLDVAKESTLNSKDGAAIISLLKRIKNDQINSFFLNSTIFPEHYFLYKKHKLSEDLKFSRIDHVSRSQDILIKSKFSSPSIAPEISIVNSSFSHEFGRINEDLDYCLTLLNPQSVWYQLIKAQEILNNILLKKNGLIDYGPTISPRQALERAFVLGDIDIINELLNKFNFSEKSSEIIKFKSYIRNGMWRELDDSTRQEPINGWELLVNECMEIGKKDKAKHYLSLMNNDEKKLNLCDKFQFWIEAKNCSIFLKKDELIQHYDKLIKM